MKPYTVVKRDQTTFFSQRSFSPPCTSAVNHLHWDAGPFLKMGNLQVFGEAHSLLVTYHL